MTRPDRTRSPRPRPSARPRAATTSTRLYPAPRAAEAGERTVTLAAITGAHGLGGEVKLKLFTEDLAAYRHFNGGTLTLLSLRGLIARFEEVRDRDAAEALRGVALTVPRSALPPLPDDEYYHADLIGLPCVAAGGAPLGHVVLVENFGAGDVLEIERADGTRFMVPMRPEAVPEWDGDRLVIDAAFVG